MAGQVIERDKLGVLTKIAQGGQGLVFGAPNVKVKFAVSMVYKEYKPQVRGGIDFTALAAMPALVEQSLPYAQAEQLISIAAWPCAMVEDGSTPTGFVMPAIPQQFFLALTTVKGSSTAAAEFQHLLNHSSVLAARGINVDDAQRYTLLRETASGLAFLHKHGVSVGELSPKNLLFSLTPHPAIYFIDCDAMRINGVSALPQVETPGWQVPTGEELATVYSDTYKLGILALRLLAGDHDTTNPQHLPATTPDLLGQIITDTLTNPPQRRPLPDAWNYVLGHAIEHARHQRKTAGPPPVSAAAAPPPIPVVHSRPSTPTPQSRPPTPPPTPAPPPPASAIPERPPIHEGFTAGFESVPPSTQAHKRLTTTALLIGAIVILVVALALAIGIPALTKHHPTAVPVAQPPPTTAPTTVTPTTAPPVAEAALEGLLLSPDQINTAMGATGMTIRGTWTVMGDNSARISNQACLFTITEDEITAYAGSGWSSVHSQALHDEPGGGANATHNVGESVVLFSSAHDADAFFTASARQWPACAGQQYTIDGGDVYTVGPVSNTNGTLSAIRTRSRDGQTCQFALTVANNVAIAVCACSKNAFQSDFAVNIAHQIAAKVPTA